MTDNDTDSDPLSTEELVLMGDARRWHSGEGRPQEALRIKLAIEAGRRLTDVERQELLRTDDTKPIVEVDPSITPPPRKGKGATRSNWQKYARLVTDWEPEVIDGAKMNELIKMLEANGVIQPLEV